MTVIFVYTQIGLIDLEVNTMSKILFVMVLILSLIMMILKVRAFIYLLPKLLDRQVVGNYLMCYLLDQKQLFHTGLRRMT